MCSFAVCLSFSPHLFPTAGPGSLLSSHNQVPDDRPGLVFVPRAADLTFLPTFSSFHLLLLLCTAPAHADQCPSVDPSPCCGHSAAWGFNHPEELLPPLSLHLLLGLLPQPAGAQPSWLPSGLIVAAVTWRQPPKRFRHGSAEVLVQRCLDAVTYSVLHVGVDQSVPRWP